MRTAWRWLALAAMLGLGAGRTSRAAETTWQVDLVDGGRIVGPAVTNSIEIATEFGTLRVPLDKIAEMRLGFVSRPNWERRVDALIEQLADDEARTREQAEVELRGIGSRVREVLEDVRLDDDAERRQRVRRVLAVMPEVGLSSSWPRQDIVTTAKQRFAGKIKTTHIEISSAWGTVRVPVADIERLSPPASRRQVDLLKEIDLERYAVAGKWNWQGAALVSSPSNRARVQAPVAPPAEYEVHVKATPVSGRKIRGREIADSLFVGIVVGGRPCYVAIDSFTDIGGPFAGLDAIDGKRTHMAPLYKGALLRLGAEADILVRVRRDGVKLAVDGTEVFAWEGDPARLSVTPGWQLGDSRFLGLGVHQTTYKISEYRLVPIDDPPPVANSEPGDWSVALDDGTLVAGRVDAKQTLSLDEATADGQAKTVAIGEVRSMRRSANGKTLFVQSLADAARSMPLASTAKDASLAMETQFGRIAVPLAAIREAAATGKKDEVREAGE